MIGTSTLHRPTRHFRRHQHRAHTPNKHLLTLHQHVTNMLVTLMNAQVGNGSRVDAGMIFSQDAVSHGRD